jgi:lipooligosaccharide transport system permease protein
VSTFGLDLSLRAAWRVWQRNLTVYKRTFHLNIVPNFLEPVFYLLALGTFLGKHLPEGALGRPYLEYIAPGLVAYNAAMGATYEVTYNVFVKMTFARTYDSILAAPVSAEDIVLGECLWAVTRAVIYAGAFLVVAVLVGAVPPVPALLVFLVAPIVGLLFAALGMIYTAWVPVIDFYNFYFTLFVIPLFLFSGIFFPLSDLPLWLQRVVFVTPLYPGVRVASDLAHGEAGPLTAVLVAALGVSSVGLLVVAMRMMRGRLVK